MNALPRLFLIVMRKLVVQCIMMAASNVCTCSKTEQKSTLKIVMEQCLRARQVSVRDLIVHALDLRDPGFSCV